VDNLVKALREMREALEKCVVVIQERVEALREDEEQYRALVENSADAIVIVAEAIVVFANKSFLTLHGLTDVSQALGPIDRLVLPEDKERVIEWFLAWQRGVFVSDIYEYRIRRPDGDIRTMQTTSSAITYKGKPAELANIRDVTNMNKTETSLHASEELLAEILDNAAEAIISIDESHHITVFNQGAEQIYGYSAKEVVGRPLDLLLPERFIEAHRQHVSSFAASTEKARRIAEGFQVFGRRKDGSEFPAEASISKLKLSHGTIFTVILWDITERKKAEEELKRSREDLRILAARLQQAREEERALLAREIHDQLSGALTALKMDLSFLANRVPQEDAALTEKTESMARLIDVTLNSVRNIATQLRPSVLDDLGLIAAIEWQTEEFQNRSGIKCRRDLDREEIALDKNRSTAIFRIFQEALTNVARHAQANEVWISLRAQAGTLILQIRDNGRGITQEEISSSKSLGLLGMRERAFAFGGEVVIGGGPGQGTMVTLKIPVNQE